MIPQTARGARGKAQQLQGIVPYWLDAPDHYCVPSCSQPGRAHLVRQYQDAWSCSCQRSYDSPPCWHIYRVQLMLGEWAGDMYEQAAPVQ